MFSDIGKKSPSKFKMFIEVMTSIVLVTAVLMILVAIFKPNNSTQSGISPDCGRNCVGCHQIKVPRG